MNREREYSLHILDLRENKGIPFEKRIISENELRNIINSPKVLGGNFSFQDVYIEPFVVKVLLDVRLFDKYILEDHIKKLVGNKYLFHAVWVILKGGVEISFRDFESILKVIRKCSNQEYFEFSIGIDDKQRYEISCYILFIKPDDSINKFCKLSE